MNKSVTQSLAAALLLCFAAVGELQAQVVSGVVTDAAGETLIGVNVIVPGTTNGTVTDYDGAYTLDVQGADSLVFRYVGYAEQTIAIGGRTTINLGLSESSQLLDEVVVVGYGIQRRSDVTGSVGSVEGEEITRIATGDAASALQGKIAGVQVVPTSGTPGASSVVRIRGIGTFGDSKPLYVVDGMLTDDITFLNPNDIERIDVLKDASATAIYGSRGANGVILVTTRRGKEGGGSLISADVYYGQQSLLRKIDLAGPQEFALLANQLARNENRAIPYADSLNFPNSTDWQDAVFRQASIASYQVSASGANDRGSYLVSANHFAQEGILKGGDFDRTTARFNGEFQVKPRVTVGQNLAFSLRRSVNGPGLLDNAYRGYPTLPLLDSAGNFAATNPVGNPLAQLAFQNSEAKNTRVLGNVYVEYQPIDGLQLRSSFGLDRGEGKSENFVPAFFVSPLQQNQVNSLTIRENTDRTWLWENTATYSRSFGDSRLTVLGGVTAQDSRGEFLVGSVQGLPNENKEARFLRNGVDSTRTNDDFASENSYLSYLARVNYAFSDRYLLTVSFRADGSSKFGPNNRFGYFPSAALGWRIDQESFYPTDFVVNRMKARLGYGVVGNDKIGDYRYVPLVSSDEFTNAVFGTGEQLNIGRAPLGLANPDLKWEETVSFNAGVELGLFQDKLTAEVDYYAKQSNGILLVVPIADYIGANPPTVNAATIRNSGVELLLSWRDKIGKVSYNASINGATVNNEVRELGRNQTDIFSGNVGSGLNATRSNVGNPVGSFYGFITDGVIQNQAELESIAIRDGQVVGDLRFRDINGIDENGNLTGQPDGKIDGNDRTFIGSPIPDVTFGATFGVDVAGFDLAIDFYGQAGNEIYNQKKTSRFNTYNFERSFLDSWTGEGTSDTEPRLTNGGVNYQVSQRFIEKGDFLRLRNLTLGYSLPGRLNDNGRVQKLRIYASGTNLLIWDSYSGYTPEVISESPIDNGIDRGVYPVPRIVNLGIQVGF